MNDPNCTRDFFVPWSLYQSIKDKSLLLHQLKLKIVYQLVAQLHIQPNIMDIFALLLLFFLSHVYLCIEISALHKLVTRPVIATFSGDNYCVCPAA